MALTCRVEEPSTASTPDVRIRSHGKVEGLCGLDVCHELELGRLLNRQIALFAPFRMRSMYPVAWQNCSAKSAHELTAGASLTSRWWRCRLLMTPEKHLLFGQS